MMQAKQILLYDLTILCLSLRTCLLWLCIHIHVSMSETERRQARDPYELRNGTEVLAMCGMSYSIFLPWLYNIILPLLQIFTWCIFMCSQGFFLCLPMNILPWLGVNGITDVYYGPTWQSVLLIEVFPSEMSKCFYLCHVVHYNISK